MKKKKVSKESFENQIVNLGNRIKELRKKKGFTNYEFFAYENKIGRSQYGQYEKGADMRFTSLLRLLEIHGISLKEFFSKGFD